MQENVDSFVISNYLHVLAKREIDNDSFPFTTMLSTFQNKHTLNLPLKCLKGLCEICAISIEPSRPALTASCDQALNC